MKPILLIRAIRVIRGCSIPRRSWRFIAFVAAPALLGCYNAAALRQEKQQAIATVRLEEVDLGAYRVSLPHVLGEATDSVVDFHAFGQVAANDREALKHVLETRGPELRSRMLSSIRGMNDATFQEPKLDTLRRNIAEVVNAALDQKAVQHVGFYSYTFSTM